VEWGVGQSVAVLEHTENRGEAEPRKTTENGKTAKRGALGTGKTQGEEATEVAENTTRSGKRRKNEGKRGLEVEGERSDFRAGLATSGSE
jgi:hypothetical protein